MGMINAGIMALLVVVSMIIGWSNYPSIRSLWISFGVGTVLSIFWAIFVTWEYWEFNYPA